MVDGALILLLSVLAAAQVPPSLPAPQPPDAVSPEGTAKGRTATVRGRVTDRDTGQPLGRVAVTLISTVWRDEAASSSAMMAQMGSLNDSIARQDGPRYTVTSADGRFEFRQVPAGPYNIVFSASFSRGTHLDQHFGESEPRDPLKPGKRAPRIQLRDGETRDNVDIALWRAFAVEGRVVDDAGEAVANVDVNISPWESPSTSGRPRVTDDRGMFRVFGLRPGQYRVCADGAMQVEPSEDVRDRLIRTCYPSAVTDGDAHPVVVSSADAGPIEIRLQRNRTYRITGTVIDSSGAPIVSPDVSLVSVTPTGFSSSSSGVQVKAGGQFIASGIAPGDYAIHVSTGSWRVANPDEKGNREAGYAAVRVDTADVEGLIVATSKPARIAGRILLEGGAPERGTWKLSVMATPDEVQGRRRMMLGPPTPAAVRDDMSFELDGLFGPHLLMVAGLPRGWIVKSVKYRGAEVAETPVEFKSSSDPSLLEVTLTNQGAIVTGRVLGEDGKASDDAYVVMLPADVSRWRPFPGTPGITPRADGTFTIGPVRAGEYVVAAVTGMSTTRLFDPSARAEFAERILRVGERIVLAENDKHSVDLRITKLQ